jgi:hypothetical protein
VVALGQTRQRDADDREVVGLAPARREGDAVRLAAEQRCDLGPGALDRGAVRVGTGGVTEVLLQVRRIASRTSGAIGVVAL